MGPSGIRQGLPTRQLHHEDEVIMTGASLESAATATDRAAITADLKKRPGRKKTRTDDGKVRFSLGSWCSVCVCVGASYLKPLQLCFAFVPSHSNCSASKRNVCAVCCSEMAWDVILNYSAHSKLSTAVFR